MVGDIWIIYTLLINGERWHPTPPLQSTLTKNKNKLFKRPFTTKSLLTLNNFFFFSHHLQLISYISYIKEEVYRMSPLTINQLQVLYILRMKHAMKSSNTYFASGNLAIAKCYSRKYDSPKLLILNRLVTIFLSLSKKID